jgi:hypothetical protein
MIRIDTESSIHLKRIPSFLKPFWRHYEKVEDHPLWHGTKSGDPGLFPDIFNNRNIHSNHNPRNGYHGRISGYHEYALYPGGNDFWTSDRNGEANRYNHARNPHCGSDSMQPG